MTRFFTEGMSATMGFSGFGKKARQFDLDELVEETRKSAVNKNKKNIGKMWTTFLNEQVVWISQMGKNTK